MIDELQYRFFLFLVRLEEMHRISMQELDKYLNDQFLKSFPEILEILTFVNDLRDDE